MTKKDTFLRVHVYFCKASGFASIRQKSDINIVYKS